MQKTKRVKNPSKQRKRHFNAPAHIRHKLMAAPLSSELIASRGVKTLPVRKGDTVRIQRGDNKGFEGKVSRVDPKHYRIYLEGLTREKVDGTNIFLSVHPSKIQIRNLNLDDKRRKEILERKKEVEKTPKEKPKTKSTKKAEKPQATVEPKVEEVVEEKSMEESQVENKLALETVEEQQVTVEEKAPAKKITKSKTAAKKIAALKEEAPAEETEEKKTVAKPRAKRKVSEEGGE
jgi:large subunit ribosomal protein L24